MLHRDDHLAFGDVAFASGFSSVRQFNDTVRAVFGHTPTELRRLRARRRPSPTTNGMLALRLPARTPFTADEQRVRASGRHGDPGVARVRDGAYRRTLTLAHGHGVVSLSARVTTTSRVSWLSTTSATSPRPLLVAADCSTSTLTPEAFTDLLGADPALGALVRKGPGRRIPRTVDEAELAVRIVLGQQVSHGRGPHPRRTPRERRTAGPVTDSGGGLTHVFPAVEQLAEIDPAHLAFPKSRQRSPDRADQRVERLVRWCSTPAATGTARANSYCRCPESARGPPR